MLNGDDPLGDPITSNLDLAYKDIFLHAHNKGKFTAEDFDLNNVIMDDNSKVPEFVQKHEEMMGRKRKVPDNLPTFTGKTKREEDQIEPNVRRKGNDGGAIEQLEACGYEVVPDVLETDDGTWELISKLPPHILTVFRRKDPNKTELIAKHVREGSNEPDILKYLHAIRSQSPHVISFIETIPSITTEWLILPKLRSIGDQRLMNSGGVRSRVQLGWGLIKGLAYLHEHKVAHRDIKPHNLVCDGDFRLQVIDFDVAIKVKDENTETDEYRGTKGWTAPEMGEEEGPTPMYSPIKADRWSCGRVLLRHIMVRRGDKRLWEFADQLMANDPQQRPSLLEWHKWSAPLSNMANVLKDGGKESRSRKDMTEVDGESMNPPDAKRPRLVVAERDVWQELNGLEASLPTSKVF
ncbi:kinase-like domain-containing protein [Russula ochroleuca]|uniref:Kinase-like domain-containing protein n=1 Tax=Russula ochroleuca TaxID=152965 RepID=A0A9P5JX92_9AGAM|nr:kinase-like domain-containing protein [Russula ochroleuca]